MKYTTIISFSGGIDSTYYLWRWLREHPNERIVVHQCYYGSYNAVRKDAERTARSAIVSWLNRHGLRNFGVELTEWPESWKYPYHDIIGLAMPLACTILRHEDVEEIIYPFWKTEIDKALNGKAFGGSFTEFAPDHRYNRMVSIIDGIAPGCKHSIPYAHVSKEEIIEQMPKDLLRLTWWCRWPRPTNSGYAICGACDSCLAIVPMLEQAGRLHLFEYNKQHGKTV